MHVLEVELKKQIKPQPFQRTIFNNKKVIKVVFIFIFVSNGFKNHFLTSILFL